MSSRVVVIGLDSFEVTLLDRWRAAGKLPALDRFLSQSAMVRTAGSAGVYGGTVWPSFVTGASPAHHRRFFRIQAPRGSYVEHEFSPYEIQGTPFWETVGTQGKRVAIVDVPHSAPSPEINGIHVVDWASHEPEVPPTVVPATLEPEIRRRFPAQAADPCETTLHDAGAYEVLRRHLDARLQVKLELSRELLARESWDLFVTVFGEAHCAGHQWWHLHDADHPAYDAELAASCGDLLERTYVQLDGAVGRLLDDAGDDVTVALLCSHGMGPLHAESVIFDEILRRLEGDRRAGVSPFRWLKALWYAMPVSLRSKPILQGMKHRLQPTAQKAMLLPERAGRRFYAMPHNPHAGAVRINLRGREEHGVVAAADYRGVCEELRDELLRLVDADTGSPVVEDVIITADVDDGPYRDELPDLLVQWSRRTPVRRLTSPRIGTLKVPLLGGRTGDHTRVGLFAVRDPGLVPGDRSRTVGIPDVTATIVRLTGAPVAAGQGSAIEELLPPSARGE